jgi:hypothetical protein
LRGGPGPLRAAEVEDRAVGGEQGGDDVGVAREPPRGLRRDRGGSERPVQHPDAGRIVDPVVEAVVVDGDHDGGSVTAVVGQDTACE